MSTPTHRPRTWNFASHDASVLQRLQHEVQVSPLLAQILAARGCETLADAKVFLEPKLSDLHDPNLLPGVEKGSEIVAEALKSKRPILIYGDYDVDGVTSTSLLYHCFKLCGGVVDFYIPDRREEGYGLNAEALKRIHEEEPNRLVITVDCGICSVKEVAYANELGLDVIITDHHTLADELPAAACLIHPRLPGSEYPFGGLCGVGVAFKLAWAICQRLGDGQKASPQMREFLMSAVGLTAIGTIADVVPLVDENRIIVRYGLGTLTQRCSIGMRALFKILELDKRRSLRADDVGFKIAPRINAAGRLKQARLAVELLTTEREDRASMLSQYLNQLNRERQTLERRMVRQAKEMVRENPEWEEMSAIVLSDEQWHPGVIGIVANRVGSAFEKPTVMIAMDRQQQVGQGSGRSYGTCDLHAALSHCRDHLVTFGGHQFAAGLKIEAENVDAFRSALSDYFATHDPPDEQEQIIAVDAEVRFADVTIHAVDELDRLGPFGEGNPTPIFSATSVTMAEPPRRMGETQNHLSVKFEQFGIVMRAIAFGRGDWADELAQVHGPLAICFKPQINEFRGRRNVELELIDWQVREA